MKRNDLIFKIRYEKKMRCVDCGFVMKKMRCVDCGVLRFQNRNGI